jgi:hypothetical protein
VGMGVRRMTILPPGCGAGPDNRAASTEVAQLRGENAELKRPAGDGFGQLHQAAVIGFAVRQAGATLVARATRARPVTSYSIFQQP